MEEVMGKQPQVLDCALKEGAYDGSDLRTLLAFQIYQLSSKLAAQGRAVLARHGSINLPQWRIIRVLGMGVDNASNEVRIAAGIDKGQFSRTLETLIDAGLVRTEPLASDRRTFAIHLTAEGRALHDEIAPDLQARHNHLLKGLSPAQVRTLFIVLEKLSESAADLEFLDAARSNR
ncbi:winged helix DNA-binding protein [Rhodobacterales bacterium HKCCE2091]|nr:winged helix DNA-binding protein [Rhodobacterales bacterium HKCCE2091]